jgi:hypothetical protein
VGATFAALGSIYGLIKATHNMRLARERKAVYDEKCRKVQSKLALKAKASDAMTVNPRTVRALLNQILEIDPNPAKHSDFEALDKFRDLCTGLSFAEHSRSCTPSSDWDLWKDVISRCDNLRHTMINPYADVKSIEFRVKLIRLLFDLIFLTDTLRDNPWGVSNKLYATKSVEKLIEVWKKRGLPKDKKDSTLAAALFSCRHKDGPVSAAGQKAIQSSEAVVVVDNGSAAEKWVFTPNERVLAELEAARASLLCTNDKARFFGNCKRKEAPKACEPWYLDFLLMDRLAQYAIAESSIRMSNKMLDKPTSENKTLTDIITAYKEARFTGLSLKYAKNWLMKLKLELKDSEDKALIQGLIDGSKAHVNKLRSVLALASVTAISTRSVGEQSPDPKPVGGTGINPAMASLVALAMASKARHEGNDSGSSGETDNDPHSDQSSLSSAGTASPPRAGSGRASVRTVMLQAANSLSPPQAVKSESSAIMPKGDVAVVMNPLAQTKHVSASVEARASFAGVLVASRRNVSTTAARASVVRDTASWQ